MILIKSFGYKYGTPTNCDLTFSIQKLPSAPKYIRDKYLGTSKSFQQEFFQMSGVQEYYDLILSNIKCFIISNSDLESITIGIGCQEGKHRSVAFVERIFKDLLNKNIQIEHRDIKRPKSKSKNYQQERTIKYQSKIDSEN